MEPVRSRRKARQEPSRARRVVPSRSPPALHRPIGGLPSHTGPVARRGLFSPIGHGTSLRAPRLCPRSPPPHDLGRWTANTRNLGPVCVAVGGAFFAPTAQPCDFHHRGRSRRRIGSHRDPTCCLRLAPQLRGAFFTRRAKRKGTAQRPNPARYLRHRPRSPPATRPRLGGLP